MSESAKPQPSPFEKLREFGRKILSVPKSEIVRGIEAEKRQRAEKKKKPHG